MSECDANGLKSVKAKKANTIVMSAQFCSSVYFTLFLLLVKLSNGDTKSTMELYKVNNGISVQT